MSYLGTTKIGKMFLGTVEIAKAYLGTNLVFQNGGSPTPPTPTIVYHDRVRFDGTAYILTDIVLPANGSLLVSTGGETRKGNQGIFNARAADDSIVFGIWFNSSSSSSTKNFSHRYCNGTTGSGNPTVSGWTSRTGIFLGYTKWGTSANALSTTRGSTAPTKGIELGAASSSYRYTGALGWVYIYDSTAQAATSYTDLKNNYTPVYTLKPCEYNGAVGYWCEETSTFYGNSAGTGTLSYEDN